MSFALSSLLTRAVSEWEWENTAAFARRQVDLVGLDALFIAPQDAETHARWAKDLARLFAGLPEIVRIKAWDRNATVLWSDEARLIGQRFPENLELRESLAGKVSVEIKDLARSEHVYERGRFGKLAEIYVPISRGGEVVGVLEFYKTPDRLFATVRRGTVIVWTISLGGGLALYLVLLPLVRQVYGRQVREETLQAHATQLEREVAERTQALQTSQGQLRQAQKMEAVARLAGGIAHDFNNLLTVITGQAQLMQCSLGPDGALHQRVDLIQKAAGQAVALTQQLLAFSRKQVLQPKVLDLNAVVAGMNRMLDDSLARTSSWSRCPARGSAVSRPTRPSLNRSS